MSQTKEILKALEAGEKLTPIDALIRFNCFRLGARIYDLRQMGKDIKSRMIEVKSGKFVAEYSIQTGRGH